MAKKFHAVKIGRETGIFESWSEAEKQVKGFPGASYKGFYTREEAEKFLTKSKLVSPVASIYAVAVGRVPGLYFSWDEAKAQIDGFSGAKYCKCKTKEDAEAFLEKVL